MRSAASEWDQLAAEMNALSQPVDATSFGLAKGGKSDYDELSSTILTLAQEASQSFGSRSGSMTTSAQRYDAVEVTNIEQSKRMI